LDASGGSARALDAGLIFADERALRQRVHFNGLKIYLPRRTGKEAGVERVDILQHEQRTTGELQADVFSLEGPGAGGSRGVEWIKMDRGVG